MKKRETGPKSEEVLNKVGKSRRGFIRKLVEGTAYAAPLIATFYMDSTKNAFAQGRSSTGAGAEKKAGAGRGGSGRASTGAGAEKKAGGGRGSTGGSSK